MILAREDAQTHILVNDQCQSQRADISVILVLFCVWEVKNLGSLKFFLRYTSNSLGPVLPKAQSASSCFSYDSPLRVRVGQRLMWLTVLVQLGGEQCSSFFVCKGKCLRSFLAYNGRVDKLEYHHFFNLQLINGSRQLPISHRETSRDYMSPDTQHHR